MNWLLVVLMSIKRWIKFERRLRAYCSNICILCPKLKKNNFSRSCCCRHLLEKLLRQQLRRSGVKPVLLEAPSSLWGCLQRLPTVELDVRKKGDDHDIGLSWVAATEAPQLKLGLVKVYIKLQTGKLEMYLKLQRLHLYFLTNQMEFESCIWLSFWSLDLLEAIQGIAFYVVLAFS